MKRIVCLLLICLLIGVFSTSVFASDNDDDAFPFRRIAMLSMTSSAEGSNINFFFMRPAIAYVDEPGNNKGTMFDAVILDIGYVPKTPVEAENYITALFTKGANLDAAESVVTDLKNGGFVDSDYKYPVFISMPHFYGLFNTMEERKEFCTYFVVTFNSVLKSHEFNNIYIAGFSFGIEYDAVPDFRNDCIGELKEYDYKTIAFTTISGNIDADACFATNTDFGRRLNVAEQYTGLTLELEGVPTADDDSALSKLKSNFDKFKASSVNSAPVVFTFNAFNDLHDCASALDEAIPNETAREAYELIADIIEYTGEVEEESSSDETSEVEEGEQTKKSVVSNTWFWVVLVLSGITLHAVVLYIVTSVKKGKKNDK